MIPAWNGSIEMQKSHGNSGAFPNLMDSEGLINAWLESGSADEIYARFIKKDGES